MITQPVREFLQKPLVARMSTIDPNGYPHTVPVWFALDGDTIVFISVSSTQKVSHLRANDKGAVVIGGDADDGGGYLLKGRFAVEPDPGDWVKQMTYRYQTPEQAEKDIADWAGLDIIVLRLIPEMVLKVA